MKDEDRNIGFISEAINRSTVGKKYLREISFEKRVELSIPSCVAAGCSYNS